MVYGANIFHNVACGTNIPNAYEIDTSQLALFRLDKSKIAALNDDGVIQWYWLRSVSHSLGFCVVGNYGRSGGYALASDFGGVRPCFLIY